MVQSLSVDTGLTARINAHIDIKQLAACMDGAARCFPTKAPACQWLSRRQESTSKQVGCDNNSPYLRDMPQGRCLHQGLYLKLVRFLLYGD